MWPAEAIFAEADVTAQWTSFTEQTKELAAKGPVA